MARHPESARCKSSNPGASTTREVRRGAGQLAAGSRIWNGLLPPTSSGLGSTRPARWRSLWTRVCNRHSRRSSGTNSGGVMRPGPIRRSTGSSWSACASSRRTGPTHPFCPNSSPTFGCTVSSAQRTRSPRLGWRGPRHRSRSDDGVLRAPVDRSRVRKAFARGRCHHVDGRPIRASRWVFHQMKRAPTGRGSARAEAGSGQTALHR